MQWGVYNFASGNHFWNREGDPLQQGITMIICYGVRTARDDYSMMDWKPSRRKSKKRGAKATFSIGFGIA